MRRTADAGDGDGGAEDASGGFSRERLQTQAQHGTGSRGVTLKQYDLYLSLRCQTQRKNRDAVGLHVQIRARGRARGWFLRRPPPPPPPATAAVGSQKAIYFNAEDNAWWYAAGMLSNNPLGMTSSGSITK